MSSWPTCIYIIIIIQHTDEHVLPRVLWKSSSQILSFTCVFFRLDGSPHLLARPTIPLRTFLWDLFHFRYLLDAPGGLRRINPGLSDEKLAGIPFGDDCLNRSENDICGTAPSIFSGSWLYSTDSAEQNRLKLSSPAKITDCVWIPNFIPIFNIS